MVHHDKLRGMYLFACAGWLLVWTHAPHRQLNALREDAHLSCVASRVPCREATRELYAPFESNMKYCSSDVYQHEMPGGQYTNLKFQATSLGLGDSWGKVQQSYAAANRALGDIVKVRGRGINRQ